jgi:hypothetical protein
VYLESDSAQSSKYSIMQVDWMNECGIPGLNEFIPNHFTSKEIYVCNYNKNSRNDFRDYYYAILKL